MGNLRFGPTPINAFFFYYFLPKVGFIMLVPYFG